MRALRDLSPWAQGQIGNTSLLLKVIFKSESGQIITALLKIDMVLTNNCGLPLFL